MVQNKMLKDDKPKRLDCIPILHVRGTHYNVGLSIGRMFGSMIKEMLSSWSYFNDTLYKSFLEEKGQLIYKQTLGHVQTKFPNYVDEIRGMAQGSGIPFEKLFLLNIDSMLDNDEVESGRGATGCTSIICNKEEVILGHTEDAMAEILNHVYIISAEIQDSEGKKLEKFTTFSYAGHLMGYTMGFNEHGMVHSVNTLFPQVHKNGTPRAFIARSVLGASSLGHLLSILRDSGSGISDGMSVNVHFNKDEPQFYNIEVLPPIDINVNDGKTESTLDIFPVNPGQASAHCNKYLRLSANEKELPVSASTGRHDTIDRHPEPRGLSDIKFILSDQTDEHYPIYICDELHARTKLPHIKTVAVGLFNLVEKTWTLYTSKPWESEPVAVLHLNF